jgi:hypothetical protein
MGRIKLGFKLAGKSWQVLRSDASLAWFPVISGAATVFLFALLWAPALGFGLVEFSSSAQSGSSTNIIGWLLLALTAYLATTIAVFCNVALASCVAHSLEGKDTSLGQGFAVAGSRIKQILAWAFISTVVSMLIRTLQQRGGLAGLVLGSLGGIAWSLATLFVVPVVALEGVGPIDALKLSAQTFKARWGEGLVGNALIGLVTSLSVMLCLAAMLGGAILLGPVSAQALIAWLAFWLMLILALSAVMAALNQVFNTSLYIFSKEGIAKGPFTEQEFQAAFRPKKKR